MFRLLCVLAVLVPTSQATARENESAGDAPQVQRPVDLDKLLAEVYKHGRENRRRNVPPDHGRFLWLMTEATGAKRVLEIGTSSGYSSLWIARGLRETGGHLVTIEIDKEPAAEARANFKRAGFDRIITLHEGDAFKIIPTLQGQFDMIFIDAWKEDYKKFFEMTFPKLRPGGIILAHNAVRMADDMKDFLDAVKTHPQLITNVVQIGSDGFAVSYKKGEAGSK